MGGILAFIGATELSKFGAGVYVANLVAIGMAREMAALMTAIIMAGRTGGAYAAQIAAMEGAEEIDALRALGVPIFDLSDFAQGAGAVSHDVAAASTTDAAVSLAMTSAIDQLAGSIAVTLEAQSL